MRDKHDRSVQRLPQHLRHDPLRRLQGAADLRATTPQVWSALVDAPGLCAVEGAATLQKGAESMAGLLHQS